METHERLVRYILRETNHITNTIVEILTAFDDLAFPLAD